VLTQEKLGDFYGTEHRHHYALLGIKTTDGIEYLQDEAQCHWLIDAIGSYYRSHIKTNEYLDSFCIWELSINSDGKSAVLTCKEDSDTEPVITQEIEFTDFADHCNINPLKLYQECGVLLLPSEH
jgi:hypothetical protein